MPARTVLALASFKGWCRIEPSKFEDAQKGQVAATAEHDYFSRFDVEAQSVCLVDRGGEEVFCGTTEEKPFRLRVLDTPLTEFKDWEEHPDGWFLTPRWYVRVIADPAGRAPGAGKRGTLAYIRPRTYVALKPYPALQGPAGQVKQPEGTQSRGEASTRSVPAPEPVS